MATVKKMGKWISITVLCLIATMSIGGWIYQSVAQSSDLSRWPAPGRLLDVDGDLMHLYCQGVGSPTIVVEVGNGAYYSHWHDMNRELSKLTRVCAYDRAGMGYSDSVGRMVGTDEVARRLQKLLSAADIADDLILVGWSAGGIHVRSFYKQFPDKVAGMILVDSSHEQQQRRLPAAGPQSFDTRRMLAPFGPFGVVRLSGLVDRAMEHEPGSDEHKRRSKAVYNRSYGVRAYFAEFDAFSMDQSMNRTPPSLGDLRLTVITRGREVPQGGIQQQREKAWQQMQKELSALSSQGKQVIARESGHSIHLDQPQLVLDAAQEMLKSLRTPEADSNSSPVADQ